MIPLGGTDFPATAADLANALRAALRPVVRLPDERALWVLGTAVELGSVLAPEGASLGVGSGDRP